MSSLVDSNVLIDIINPVSGFAAWSRNAVVQAAAAGKVVVNQIVLAEMASYFLTADKLDSAISHIAVTRESIPWEAAHRAGIAHAMYRQAGGSRERVLPDFLIGAHAAFMGYSLVSRDAARFRSYFPGLNVIAPDTHP
jgi:predicted nucleic acid-binding protein